jgi:hypothetical protein
MASYWYRISQIQQGSWNESTGKYDKNAHKKIYRGIALKDKIFTKSAPIKSIEEEGKHDTVNPFELWYRKYT